MIAFVLSGGGFRGCALQTGALMALVERGIISDIVIGTSAGAIVGAYYALFPLRGELDHLADILAATTRDEIYPGQLFPHWLWRAFVERKPGAVSSEHVLNKLNRAVQFGGDGPTFGDLRIPFYAVTANLSRGDVERFGGPPDRLLLPCVAASTCIPGLQDPMIIDGQAYVDGGILEAIDIQFAISLGATRVYAVDVNAAPIFAEPPRTVFDVAAQTLSAMLWYSTKRAYRNLGAEDVFEMTERAYPFVVGGFGGVDIKPIRILDFADKRLDDFTQAREMIQAGYRHTKEILNGM